VGEGGSEVVMASSDAVTGVDLDDNKKDLITVNTSP
jgi:hypothetical protein